MRFEYEKLKNDIDCIRCHTVMKELDREDVQRTGGGLMLKRM